MQPLLKNWKNFPPNGGWGMQISVKGQNFQVGGLMPSEVVEKIAKLYRVNGLFKGIGPIWDMCNSVWCKRDPARCGTAGAEQSRYIPKDNTVTSPQQYGPKLWAMLDSFGLKGAFTESAWAMAIAHITRVLDPSNEVDVGCSTCHNEWIDILRESPPSAVKSSRDAARWVFDAHNRVNARTGKRQYVWETAVLRNHWVI